MIKFPLNESNKKAYQNRQNLDNMNTIQCVVYYLCYVVYYFWKIYKTPTIFNTFWELET